MGHEVPGMRGLYGPRSRRMRDDLTAALQARWEDSLRQRARIGPALPCPAARRAAEPAPQASRPPRSETRPKMISQIPPNKEEDPIRQVG